MKDELAADIDYIKFDIKETSFWDTAECTGKCGPVRRRR